MSFILILFALLYAPHTFSETSELGISELLMEAQKTQLEWKAASVAVEQAKADVTVERSSLLPDLALTSSFSRDWQSLSSPSEATNSQAALVSTWSIFDNGTQYRRLRRAKLGLERAEAEEHRIREDVAFGLLSRYTNYLLLLRQEDISKRKLELFRNQFKMSQRLYKQGLKTRSDNSRLEAEVARAELNVLRFQDRLKDSFKELRRFIGNENLLSSPSDLKLQKLESIFNRLKPVATKSEPDLSGVPVVRSSKLDVDIQKILTHEEQVSFWPGVYLSGEGGYGSTAFVDTNQSFNDRDRFFATARLQFKWTLFNWGGISGEYQKALLSERFSESELSQTILNVKTSYSRLDREGTLLLKSVGVLQNLLAIEQRSFRDIEIGYREGRASYLDLSTSLERRFQAELDLEQEILDSLINIAERSQLLGNLYEACLKL